MRETTRHRAGARMGRLAALGAGILLLAGCATGYSFVQPDVAGGGGYYTSDGPYSGRGYYDYYGTGPYYPDTSGYGYYNGTWPYGGAIGYYDPGYGYGAYGSGWTFGLGISNVWNFPGYWGPWYTTVFPSGGCYSWCGSRHYRHGHDHDHSWRHEDTSSGPPDVGDATREHDLSARREREREITAWRHDHYVRSPRWGTTGRYAGSPAPVQRIAAPMAREGTFAGHPVEAVAAPVGMPAPTGFSRGPSAAPRTNIGPPMVARPAPAPAVQPSTRTSNTPGVKIR